MDIHSPVDLARLERVCHALEQRASRSWARIMVICDLARATGELALYGDHTFAGGHVVTFRFGISPQDDRSFLFETSRTDDEPTVVRTPLGDRMVREHRFHHFAANHAGAAWRALALAVFRQVGSTDMVHLRVNGRTHWFRRDRGGCVRVEVTEVDLDAEAAA